MGTTQQLNEISGIAVSRSLPGNLWVHQDSGDSARFYGLNTAGAFHSTITLSGAPAVDWEDMTIGPKPGGGNYLYFGDIGDNSANRFAGVDIIRVTEPTATGDVTLTSAEYKVKRVLYPGLAVSFPKNAESLFVDPATSDLFIITKQNPGGIYRLPASQFEAAGSSTLESLGNINAPLNNPTSADISPDGRFIVVRNSSSGGTTSYLFERGAGQSVAAALQGTPTSHTLRSEVQGEAIGWNPDGSGFYSISEGLTKPIWFYTFSTLPTNVSAGGPYTIDEGGSLNLSGSATGTAPLTYSWDVNGDGVFGDAAGPAPTLSWAQLVALGINDGLTTRNVKVRVADNYGHQVDSAMSLLTVNNVAPSADAGGPYWLTVGTSLNLVGVATDPVDALSYSWDVNGDGVFGDATGASPSLSWAYLQSLGIAGSNSYDVRLRADDGDGGVTDSLPELLLVGWVDTGPSTIAARHIFYNQSVWDGNSAAISAVNDNAAIAPGKVPHLRGGGLTVAANLTSFTRGINGIMVDLSAGGNHTGITATDFVFKVGNNNSPNLWAAAPAPSAISVIPGSGVGGSDRVEITWASGVIKNQWLEVQVLPTANTGLAATDVHFWGNKIGDSASSSPATLFETTSTDSAQVFATLGAGKPITDLRDYNRDGQVTSTDAAIVFANIGNITRISIAAGGPFAPEADPAVADDGGSAVASALAAFSRRPYDESPAQSLRELASARCESGRFAVSNEHREHVSVADRARGLAILQQHAHELHLDDELLDSLLAK